MSKPGRTSFVSEWFSRTFGSFAAKVAAQVEKRSGAGMSFVMTHGRSGFFYYERLINRERFAQNSLAFGIRLEF